MTTYTEMLEQPQIKTKIESTLSGHIMGAYLNAGLTPPVPFLHVDTFVYADAGPQKYENHLREGMKLFAEILDELEGNNEQK